MSSDAKNNQMKVEKMLKVLDNIGDAVGAHMKENGGIHPEILKNMAKNNPKDMSYKETLRAKKDAPAIIQKILNDLESGIIAPPVSYEDTCQSPIIDIYDAQLLREKWSSGMDMPHSMNRPCGMRYFSPEFMAAFLGNFDDYIRIIEKKSPKEIKTMLNKREGYLNLSPIFLPIIGARIFHNPQLLQVMGGKDMYSPLVQQRSHLMHMEVLEKMVKLGTNLNMHDLAGYTPLHHCLTCSGNEYTMQMAELLLKNGANVNAVNRFGDYPLMECIQTQNVEFIKLLIRYKADPLLKNYEGYTARYIGRHTPKICTLLKEGEKNVVKEERKAAKADKKLKVCGKCDGFAEKRCSSCFLVWYCGPACQKSDWPAHKEVCKNIRDEYLEVTMFLHDKHQALPFSINTRKYHPDKDQATKRHFIVKVQPPLKPKKGETKHLLVYNEKRDVQYWIKEGTELARILTKAVAKQESNIFGKGFFYSVIKNGKHFIHPKVLPPETW